MYFTFGPCGSEFKRYANDNISEIFLEKMEEHIFRKSKSFPYTKEENHLLDEFMSKKWAKEMHDKAQVRTLRKVSLRSTPKGDSLANLQLFEESKLVCQDHVIRPQDLIRYKSLGMLSTYVRKILSLEALNCTSLKEFFKDISRKYLCRYCKYGSKLYKINIYAIVSFLNKEAGTSIEVVEAMGYYFKENNGKVKTSSVFGFRCSTSLEGNVAAQEPVPLSDLIGRRSATRPGFDINKPEVDLKDKYVLKRIKNAFRIRISLPTYEDCDNMIDNTTWDSCSTTSTFKSDLFSDSHFF